jgi:transposase
MDKHVLARIENVEKILLHLISTNQISIPEDLAELFRESMLKTDYDLRKQETLIFTVPSDKAINHKARLMYISGYQSVLDRLGIFETDEDLNLIECFFKVLKESRGRKLSEQTYIKYLDDFIIPAYNGRININSEDIPVTKEEWRNGMRKSIDIISNKSIDSINYFKRVMCNGKSTLHSDNTFRESGMFDEKVFEFGSK